MVMIGIKDSIEVLNQFGDRIPEERCIVEKAP